MAKEIYTVVRARAQWIIVYDRKRYGPYASEQQAIWWAIDAAHRSGSSNPKGAEVRATEKGRFRAQWTYGKDPYPPPRPVE